MCACVRACVRAVCRRLDVAGRWPATSWVHYTTSCNTQSSAPEDGRNYRSKHVELTGIINKPLLLHLVGVYIIVLVTDGQANINLRTCVTYQGPDNVTS